MFSLDAERAHELGIKALQLGAASLFSSESRDEFGGIERFGLKFSNPIGVAAGFDKNGLVVNELASLGFGFVEGRFAFFRGLCRTVNPDRQITAFEDIDR